MVTQDGELFICEECGFKYEEEELAQQCEEWCRTHNSCNTEIAKKAVNT